MNFKYWNPQNILIKLEPMIKRIGFLNLFIDKFRLIIFKKKATSGIWFLVIFLSFYFFTIYPPLNFPAGTVIKIEKGQTLDQVSNYFSSRDAIKSQLMFGILVRLVSSESGIIAGDYFFEKPVSVFKIAWRVARGYYGLTPVRVTIPEGVTAEEMLDIFSSKLSEFNPDDFLVLTKDLEGYLFPDTYLFLPNVEAPVVVRTMKNNFYEKIEVIKEELDQSDKSLEDIIIMASILEEEARTTETRRMISGILWKRIEINMPLQVDAVFPYINGKNTYQLSLEDLKIDSPYNTYKHKGLPIGPISNPGIDSILAALNPIPSDYLFYLSDRQGNMYYAEDFDQHRVNKFKYINN
jgi:UPF0755 protein